MPRIPYNPVPDVQPQAPGEQVRMNVPGEAFGTNVAAALSHLGSTTEHVGDELFQRALALQQVNNENEARELQTQHAQQTAPLVADFDSKQGKDARDALQPHLKSLQQVREDLAGGASNPAVKRMFLNDTAGFMQRETFSAARHAGDEYRKYTVGNMTATQSLNLDDIRKYPDDSRGFQDKLDANADIERQKSIIAGYPPDSPQAQLAHKQLVSKAWALRILGKNDTDPDAAEAMKEEHRGDLTDTDYAQVESRVTTQARSIAATSIANETAEWGRGDEESGKPQKTVSEMIDHAKEIALERHPNDPIVGQHAATVLRSLANQEQWEKRQQSLTDKTTVEQALTDPNIDTPQKLNAVPGMADTLARLGPKYQNDIPARLNRIQVSRNRETNQNNFLRIQGLFNNDREEFLNTDLTKEHLSYSDLKYWINKQADAKDKVNDDPRVNRAVGVLRGAMGAQLEDLHIFRRTEYNKNDYDQFTGALSQAIDAWTQEKGKPPSPTDIKDTIGPNLLRTHAQPGIFGLYTKSGPFGEDVPFYRQDVTTPDAKAWIEEKRQEIMSAGDPEPSDRQMEQAYVRYQYLKQYGGKASPKAKPGEVPD